MISTAQLLLERLLEALPNSAHTLITELPALANVLELSDAGELRAVRSLASLELPRSALQLALTNLLFEVTEQHTLVLAVDDLQRVDESSGALLAGLVHGATKRPLLLIATRDSTPQETESSSLALLTSSCARLPLQPLTAAETQELMASVFGDAPNLQLLSKRVFERAGQSARQHGSDPVPGGRKHVHCDRGGWTIPGELGDSSCRSATRRSNAANTDMSKSSQLSEALGTFLLRAGDAVGIERA